MWQDTLQNHINLSETHAEGYDNAYGSIVTRNYMSYEKNRLNLAIDQLDGENCDLAVDIGCGTGRCTLDLSHHFNKVIGLDFSPKMLEVATQNAKNEQISNVDFELRNVSTYGFGEFTHKVSLLNFAFGMGSFFEDINFMIKEIKRVLASKGVFHVTFYNKDSFVCKLSSIADMGVSAVPMLESEQLVVDGIQIPCKFYSPDKIRDLFATCFKEVSFTTHPTLLPLLKDEIFTSLNVLQYCEALDDKISNDYNGYYISAIYQNE